MTAPPLKQIPGKTVQEQKGPRELAARARFLVLKSAIEANLVGQHSPAGRIHRLDGVGAADDRENPDYDGPNRSSDRGIAVRRVDRGRLHIGSQAVRGIRCGLRGAAGVAGEEHLRPHAGGQRRGIRMLDFVQLDLAAQRLERAGNRVVPGIVAGVRELRNHDRRQNAEDDHDDQDFDECESACLPLHNWVSMKKIASGFCFQRRVPCQRSPATNSITVTFVSHLVSSD